MIVLTAVFLLSFFLSVLLTVPASRLAIFLGAVDIPDRRKLHPSPVPRMGGFAFFFASLIAIIPSFSHAPSVSSQIVCAGALIVALGISDDIFALSPYPKLLAQIAIAFSACALGAQIHTVRFFSLTVNLSPVASTAVSVFYIVLLINAFNFIDGLDALATSVCICSLVSLTVMSREMHSGTVFICCALIGSLLGFLPFNMNRASVFMGDTGSTFLGLSLACITMSSFNGTLGLPTVLTVAIPVFDVIFVTARRILHGKNPFAADRRHIHHVLLKNGFPPNGIVVILSLFSLCLSALGVLLSF